jgi:hypothetical protein
MCNRLRPDGRSGLKGNQRGCNGISDTRLDQYNEKETTEAISLDWIDLAG